MKALLFRTPRPETGSLQDGRRAGREQANKLPPAIQLGLSAPTPAHKSREQCSIL